MHSLSLNEREAALDSYYHAVRKRNAGRIKEFDPLATELSLNFVRTYLIAEGHISGRAAYHGLTMPGFNTLSVLREYPEGLPLTQLSQYLLATPANITGLIDSLVRKGFVKRTPHGKDRRITLARVTPAGISWLEKYIPCHYKETRGMLSHFSSAEKKSMIGLLRKMRRSIQDHLAKSGEKKCSCAG
jgi:MarR family 2-MHQ and catechol resistance regulon transcriptional repressor